MKRILIYVIFVLSNTLLMANPGTQMNTYSITCFNINEVKPIGNDIKALLEKEFCTKKIDPKEYGNIFKNILAKIITESFLGVKPPEHWQQSTDEIINNCLGSNDLCLKESHKEFELCVKSRIPMILVQFGPWFAENCSNLNKSLIQQWSSKKLILKKTINENIGVSYENIN